MDEWRVIRRLAGLGRRADPRVVLGIGDDAAVLSPRGPVVATTDTFVDGVHFRLDLLSAADAGFRATAGAVSDIAAMGAGPLAILAALEVPAGAPDRLPLSVMRGIATAAGRFGFVVAGGNLTSTPGPLGITVTALGESVHRPLTRAGARPGDDVLVTGRPGAAALGLALLRDDPWRARRRHPVLVRAWRRPEPRLAEGLALAALPGVHAAIDVSDGLVQDLGHVLDASGVGARIDADTLPLAPGAVRAAASLGLDAVEAALTGGDDYELLVFAEPGAAAPVPGLTRIGRVTSGRGVVVTRGGRRVSLARRAGWTHR